MANDFYTVNTDLAPFTRARSDVLDTEFSGIEAGFDKLPSESRLRSANGNFVTAGGTANAITVSAPDTWTTYTGKDGYRLSIKITTANTGAVTLNVDGLGVKSCVRLDGDALAADDLQVNGIYDFFYNDTTGKFHVGAWNSFVTDAETSATNAANSASAASTSESNAAASYDSFDDRYLGSKTGDPATDNDGNTLLEGALYWNSTNKIMKVWTGSAWIDVQTESAQETLDKLKTVDGTGSGLDADTLDGKQLTQVAQLTGGADANFTATPQVGGEDVLVENTSGVIIQNAFTSTGAVASTTSAITYDDTIPQITEGAEALSISFTPKRSDSRIRITTSLQLRSQVLNEVRTAAIFVSTQSDALAVAAGHGDPDNGVGTGADSVTATADVASSSTTVRTFSSRFACTGANAITLNGNDSGDRRYGGVYASTLEVVEYIP